MTPMCLAHRDQRGFTLSELLVTVAILGLVLAGALGVQVTGTQVFLTGENQAEAQQTTRTSMLMAEDLQLIGYGYPPSPKITAATPTSITFWADLTNASAVLATDALAGMATFSVDTPAGLAPGNTIWLTRGTQWESLTITSIVGPVVTVATAPAVTYARGGSVGRPRSIRYSWDAATRTISRDLGDGSGPQVLTTGVENLLLRYFNENDVEIAAGALAANLANIRRISIATTAQSSATLNTATFTMTADVRLRNL
jgi:prepilin-type N-terminal cleavage/methylation domain-containing protein